MDQRHVATCANRCWQQLPWHARHVGDDDDGDDCVAPVMGSETDMDVDVDVDVECERVGREVGGARGGDVAWLRLFHILNASLTMSLIEL